MLMTWSSPSLIGVWPLVLFAPLCFGLITIIRQNPHTVLAQSEEDVQELKKRQCEGILTLDAVACRGPSAANIHPGFNKPHDYLYPPLTRYQMWLRGEGGDKVTYHYTLRYQDKVIER